MAAVRVPGWVYDLVADAVRDAAASIGPAADALAADADGLVRDGARLAAAVVAAIDAVGDATRLADLAEVGVVGGSTPAATASRRIQARAVAQLDVLVRTAAVVALARLGATAEYASRGAAEAARDRVLDLLDARSATAGDGTYAALRALRVAVVARVRALAPMLARIERVTLDVPTPTLVLAYEIYGDAGRAGDVVAHNRLPRPGFARGPIEIVRAPG